MKKIIKGQFLLWVFIGLCFLNLWAEFEQHLLIIYLTKPLLVTSLAIFFFINTHSNRNRFSQLIFFGLCFSIIGDTILMFSENQAQSKHFFTWGLLSFLVTHVCYLLAFVHIQSFKNGWLRNNLWVIFCGLGLLFGNIIFLWEDLPDGLKVPVIVYSTVIVMMAVSCINLKGTIPAIVFRGLLIGVLLFVLSDNIIALNKFKAGTITLFQPRLLIMTTYLLSQFLITTNSLYLSSVTKLPNRVDQS